MAFDSLSEKLNKAMRNVVGKGKLTDANMEDMLKEVRLALLEADVNYKIVKEFRGEITVNSELNEGTVFTVQIPVPQKETMLLEE